LFRGLLSEYRGSRFHYILSLMNSTATKRSNSDVESDLKDQIRKLRMKVGHSWNSSTFRTGKCLGVDPRRKPNRTDLSHSQLMGLLLSAVVEDPIKRQTYIEFEKTLRVKPNGSYSKLNDSVLESDNQMLLSRTPLWVIKRCFAKISYSVNEVSELSVLGNAATGAFLISGVVNPDGYSRTAAPGQHNRHQALVPHVPVPNAGANRDQVLRTTIVYLPSTGVFSLALLLVYYLRPPVTLFITGHFRHRAYAFAWMGLQHSEVSYHLYPSVSVLHTCPSVRPLQRQSTVHTRYPTGIHKPFQISFTTMPPDTPSLHRNSKE
jgi:hypothetical protein